MGEIAEMMPEGTGKTYALRTCDANLRGYGDFRWPESGYVEAPDWNPKAQCGQGLHGLLMGEGDCGLLRRADDAKWLVVEIDAASVVDLDGKVKFPNGIVVFCGDRHGAVSDIISRGADPQKCVYSTLTGGDYSTITGGNRSALTGGYRSTITGGHGSTITGGGDSTITGGDYSTITGGDGTTLTGGHYSTLTGGDRSTLTGGDCTTLTGGCGSTLTGGDGSTITGGDYSTLTGGRHSTLTGGRGSTLIFKYWDELNLRHRIMAYEVDGKKVKPNVKYSMVNRELMEAGAN